MIIVYLIALSRGKHREKRRHNNWSVFVFSQTQTNHDRNILTTDNILYKIELY